MNNRTYFASAHLTRTAITSPVTAPSFPHIQRPGNEESKIAPARVGPTVSLDARPVVVPILSCVLGFPVLALAIICALRYRARKARRRSQMKRLQAASNTWRYQEDQLRASYGINEQETTFTTHSKNVNNLELPLQNTKNSKGKTAEYYDKNGHLLKEPTTRYDLDNLIERSEMDFEYSETNAI